MTKYKFDTFYQALKYYAHSQPATTAIVTDSKKISFIKLLLYTDKIATFLQNRGVKPGDKVGIFLKNGWEYIAIIYAISKVGAVAVPINTQFKSTELSNILEDADISAMFVSDCLRDVVIKSIAIHKCQNIAWVGSDKLGTRFDNLLELKDESIEAERELDDEAAIFYTSGTTGKAKGAVLTNRNLLFNAMSANKMFKVSKKDRSAVFLPLYHIYTFNVIALLPLNLGASLYIPRHNAPFENILKGVLKHKVTLFFGIPKVFDILADAKLSWLFMRFNKIRLFISGAVALSQTTHEKMQNKFAKIPLIEGYGLTEASPIVSVTPPDKIKIGSVGVPIPGCKVRIVNEYCMDVEENVIGEIIVSGDNVMKGYLNKDEETKKTVVNNWLFTGDLGYLDEDGYLHIIDRKKDVIIVDGMNIYPQEIEEYIKRFENVKNCAVIGSKDELRGDFPICCIELEDPDKELNIENLKNYLKGFLADYKIPEKFVYVDKIPVTGSGKIMKFKLKQELIKKEHQNVLEQNLPEDIDDLELYKML